MRLSLVNCLKRVATRANRVVVTQDKNSRIISNLRTREEILRGTHQECADWLKKNNFKYIIGTNGFWGRGTWST